ncbi:MAG: TetR/AcrR family transcriptional regulator [Lachnospiraceae bacterium]|nr:TetR/AcrR family transcriptional regulator [Lachnospiraceae bacterium]
MKKQSETTKRTRRSFIEAFWALVREKPISKIAVNELTRRTSYNRGTFYEYFVDIDDLVANAEADLLDELKQAIRQVMPESGSGKTMPRKVSEGADSLKNLFQVVFNAMNEKIYLLLGPNGDSAFFPKVKSELLPLVEDYLPLPADSPYFDYLLDYVNSAMFSILQLWNGRGKDLPAEEISTLMQNLVLHGLMAYLPEAHDPFQFNPC